MDEYLSWRSYVSADQLQALGLTASADPYEAVGARRIDTLSDLLALDIHFNLPNDMLKKVDLASMQYGVEVRLPYLDRQLTEFALSLPENLLINRGERKSVLRSAFRDLLPEAIFSRRKQGFLLPIRQWLRKGRMRDELLELARGRSELDFSSILRFSREHEIGTFDHSVLLWSCYVYLKWRERK
jgi:asparagine synthase (glutamine-hydrolysing)